MRPQQQNRRMRGRNNNNSNNNNNNNNRKGNQNPLSRSYESNGPDVKIRGNAQQVAEKYTALARDAMSSGDRVMAENYLQHAEHYNRIIAAAQAQMPIQNVQQNRDDFDEDDFDERDDGEMAPSDQPHVNGNAEQLPDGSGPQPVIDALPGESANGDGQQPRREFRERNNRNNRNRDYQNGGRNGDYQRRERPERAEEAAGSDDASADTLPDFLTAGAAPQADAPQPTNDEAPRRSRRPRRGERVASSDGEASQGADDSVEAQPDVPSNPAFADE